MDPIISDYIAGKVMHDLRNRVVFSDEFAVKIVQKPIFDNLIKRVQDSDKEIIITLINAENSYSSWLGILLSRGIKSEPDILNILKQKWDLSDEYIVKRALVARLLDYKELSREFHFKLYEFVRKNWKKYISDIAYFMGGRENVLTGCLDRLNDKFFPKSKAWIYLCVLTYSPEREKVARTIESYISSKSSINSEVAKELLAEL